MTVAVTGATGLLGRHVLDELLGRGLEPGQLRAVGRNTTVLDALDAELGIDTVQAAYDAPETLVPAFDGVSTVVLISSSEAGRRIGQHRNVIAAARAAGVERLVYTSLLHADRKQISLAAEHEATEELIAESGLPATILRNGWFSENYLGALQQAGTTGIHLTSVGDGLVASASRRDYAAAAAVAALEDTHAERTYELSGDVAWPQTELVSAFGSILGREVELRQLSRDEHVAALTESGLDPAVVQFLVGIDASCRAGALADTTGDLSRLTGRPTTPLADTLREGHATAA